MGKTRRAFWRNFVVCVVQKMCCGLYLQEGWLFVVVCFVLWWSLSLSWRVRDANSLAMGKALYRKYTGTVRAAEMDHLSSLSSLCLWLRYLENPHFKVSIAECLKYVACFIHSRRAPHQRSNTFSTKYDLVDLILLTSQENRSLNTSPALKAMVFIN